MVEILVEEICMNEKNHKAVEIIYLHMLSWGLSYLHNFFGLPWHKRIFCKSRLLVANLIHYIPSRMFDKKGVKQHIDFIDNGASYFVENFNDHSDYIFLLLCDFILQLYEILEQEGFAIEWKFPEHIKLSVVRYRKENRTIVSG
jgi:hypothetical protein